MSQMNQREATVSTILSVLENSGVTYELNGPTPVSEVLTDSHKKEIRETLFNMFREGAISFKAEFQAKVDDDSELKKYVSGLLNNWIRKAKEFNSGEAYKAKNPGSRQFAGDEQLKAMNALLTQTTDEDAIAQINEAIEQRKAEIKASKAKKVEINVDALPDHLKGMVTTES